MRIWKAKTKNGVFVGHGFNCPGCGMSHVFDNRWQFNGDFERPTFSPSLSAKWPEQNVCHFFVTDGKIKFLNDCTHSKRGQELELKDV